MFAGVRVLRDRYVDSVELLAITRRMREAQGVDFATALMGTPANLEALQEHGIAGEALTATPNDLVVAVRATDAARAEHALEQAEQALSPSRSAAAAPAEREPRSLQAVLDGPDDPNVAIVSVAGEYAALEAHKALSAGLHVLLFSDNVSLEDEIALKEHAATVGRLAMGPGAGTASIGGCGLGFANAVSPGRVGVVAAAGTGAQEVMALLDRWGEGVSHVIGVGGRDLSQQVAGRSARLAMQALARDPGTDVIVLVSKPPSPDVAREVVAAGAREAGYRSADRPCAWRLGARGRGGGDHPRGGRGPRGEAMRGIPALRLVGVALARGAQPGRSRTGAAHRKRALLGRNALLRGADVAAALPRRRVVEHAVGRPAPGARARRARTCASTSERRSTRRGGRIR